MNIDQGFRYMPHIDDNMASVVYYISFANALTMLNAKSGVCNNLVTLLDYFAAAF